MKILGVLILAAFFAVGCGSGGGDAFDSSVQLQVTPVVTRTAPTSAAVGDTVNIFGAGFSAVPGYNVIIIDGVETLANTYALAPAPSGAEVEQITFVVPAGVSVGTHTVLVYVVDNPSNANITITITP